jgi:hypothetical protein
MRVACYIAMFATCAIAWGYMWFGPVDKAAVYGIGTVAYWALARTVKP